MDKPIIRREMLSATEDHAFVLTDGVKLYNVKDLYEALDSISDEVFRHHVAPKKNDFIPWLREVLYDKKLGRMLRWTTSKDTMREKIKEYMDTYYIQ